MSRVAMDSRWRRRSTTPIPPRHIPYLPSIIQIPRLMNPCRRSRAQICTHVLPYRRSRTGVSTRAYPDPPRSINVRPASFIGFSPFLRMASLSSCSTIRRTSRRVPAVVLPKESCARETAHEVKRKRRLSIICSCWPFKTKTAMLISYSFR
jgi:ribosomal protein L36